MPSVPLPNNSDNDRSAVPSEFEQLGDGTKGTADSALNDAPQWFVKLRAKFAWIWRLGIIKRTTAFKWEVDVACLPKRDGQPAPTPSR